MMNYRLLYFVLILLTMCQSSRTEDNVEADNASETDLMATILSDDQKVSAHPRILLVAGEEEEIKQAIQTDETWNSVHQVIIRESEKMLDKPLVEYKVKGRRLLEKSRECRKRVFYLAYAWRMTNDKKYLQRAEKELLNVSSFPDWNPSHFLDVAEMTMAVALGYDWLYKELSDSSRLKIMNAIIKKGLEPSMRSENNWWLTEDGNWNQVCNAGITFGALAVYDENPELARPLIDRSIASVKTAMKVYDPDGAFPEGYAYWAYGTTFNVYLIEALSKAFKTDFGLMENKGFMKTASYLLHMVGPTGLNFNYSDGESKSMINPAMFWFASKQNDPSLLFSEKSLMKTKDNLWGRDLPAALLWGAGIKLEALPSPQQHCWSGDGKNPVALLRSDWNDNAIYVGLKGGSPDNGHGHMDVGSFVVDAMGERWAIDLGAQDYGKLEAKGIDLWNRKQQSERWKVFRLNNRSHNTLTFNDKLQLVNGNAPIIQNTTEKKFLSATADLTSIYKDHATKAWRGAAIVDQKYVVIKDEVESISTSTVRWAMVTPAAVRLINDQTAELTYNGKILLVKVIEPGNAKIETWSTAPTNDFDEPNPGATKIGFDIQLQPKSKTTVTVHLIPNGTDVLKEYPSQLKMWRIE